MYIQILLKNYELKDKQHESKQLLQKHAIRLLSRLAIHSQLQKANSNYL